MFDAQGKCLWTYDQAYNDLLESVSRIIMHVVIIAFTHYLNKMVIIIYLYVHRNSNFWQNWWRK